MGQDKNTDISDGDRKSRTTLLQNNFLYEVQTPRQSMQSATQVESK